MFANKSFLFHPGPSELSADRLHICSIADSILSVLFYTPPGLQSCFPLASSPSTIYSSSSSLVNIIMNCSLHSLWVFTKKWKYRYDVTMPLYVMTPTEQLILNSFFFIGFVLLATAVYKYTPIQIQLVVRRAYYYYSGVDTSFCQDDATVFSPFPAVSLSAG
ncbi:hypothetical protein V1505DRAFT_392436 [Lipomyces doorenjongii]